MNDYIRPRCMSLIAAIAFAWSAHAMQPSVFVKHVIDAHFEKGYQVSVADIDTDGKPDVIALSTSPSKLVWYKNPGWEQVTITTRTSHNIDVAPYDVNGDGRPDLALASDFDLGNSMAGGTLQLLICPPDPKKQQEWEIRPVDAIPTSHRVRWADITGSGAKYLINLPIIGVGAKAPDYNVGLAFTAYGWPKKDVSNVSMDRIVIDNSLQLAHGMRIVQWDADKADEILTASFDGVSLFDYSEATKKFVKTQIGIGHEGKRPQQGSSEVALGGLRSQQSRFVAAIEPWHGNEVVVYESVTPQKFPWTRLVIDTGITDGHALACVDIDNDGNDEIVAGGRGGDMALHVYQFAAGNAEWEKTVIDKGGVGAAGLFVADINHDGMPDLVTIGTATNTVAWYENAYGK